MATAETENAIEITGVGSGTVAGLRPGLQCAYISALAFVFGHLQDTYHSPPEGVGVAGEVGPSIDVDGVFLGKINEIRRENQTKKPNVECRYELLQ